MEMRQVQSSLVLRQHGHEEHLPSRDRLKTQSCSSVGFKLMTHGSDGFAWECEEGCRIVRPRVDMCSQWYLRELQAFVPCQAEMQVVLDYPRPFLWVESAIVSHRYPQDAWCFVGGD